MARRVASGTTDAFEPSGAGRLFDGRERYGRDDEDFTIGDVYRHWPGRTVTEFDDTLFAQLTLNQHPLHSDAAYAAERRHGQRLVGGEMVLMLRRRMLVPRRRGE